MKNKWIVLSLVGSFMITANVLAETQATSTSSTNKVEIVEESKEGNTSPVKKVSIDATPNYSMNTQKIKVGEKAQLSVEPIMGVKLEGEFVSSKNEFLEVSSEGVVKGLKAGKTSIYPNFKISEKTYADLKSAYIKQPGNENILPENIQFKVRDIAKFFAIEVMPRTETKEHKVNITPHLSVDKETLEVGQTGKISVAPIEGVNVTGTFTAAKNEHIKLAEDGIYTALKPNDSAFLSPHFKLSEESLEAIKVAYIKKPGNENVKKEEIILYQNESLQVFHINIPKIVVGINWHSTVNPKKIKVGEIAKLSMASQHGYTPKVKYPLNKENKHVKVTEDGIVTGIKAGKTSINTTFNELSKEDENKIKEAYLKEKELTNLTIDDLEIGPRPTNISWTDIEVIPSSTTGGGNQSGSNNNKKTYAPVKKLPKTGEAQNRFMALWGFVAMSGVLFLGIIKNKKELEK